MFRVRPLSWAAIHDRITLAAGRSATATFGTNL